MASSMTSTVNGVKVVTHVIPMEENMNSPDLKASLVEPEKLPAVTRMFLKGGPMTLGLMQVFIGMVMMSLLTIMIVTNRLFPEFVVPLGIPFIISGIVAINAHCRLTTSRIKATLAMSIICALLAAGGICYFCWELSNSTDRCNSVDYHMECTYMIEKYFKLLVGMKGLLLTLSCLELCVCITLSVFSIRALRQEKTEDDLYDSDYSLLKDGVIS